MDYTLLGYLQNEVYVRSCMIQELTRLRDAYQEQLFRQIQYNCQNFYAFIQPQTIVKDESTLPIAEEQKILSEKQLSPDQLCDFPQINQKKLRQKSREESSLKSDTKNIPKNYGKAILSFIRKSPKSKKLARQMGISVSSFMMQIRRLKIKVSSIEDLRKMWGSEDLQHRVKKCIRVLSYDFMRKSCLQYIFNSKIRSFGAHVKYRKRIMEGIENPRTFNHIKEY